MSIGEPDGAPSVNSDHTELDKLTSWKIEYFKKKMEDVAIDMDNEYHVVICNSSIQPPVTSSNQQNYIRSSPNKTRNEEDNAKLLTETEQQTKEHFVSPCNVKPFSVNERAPRLGRDHLQTSPLDVVTNLSQNHRMSGQEDISMHPLVSHTEESRANELLVHDTANFIEHGTPFVDDSLDVSLRQCNLNTEANSSRNSSRDYVHLPSSTSAQTSGFPTDSPEDLSQDSSVFDNSIIIDTPLANKSYLRRSTVSSGICSTSSVSNGYVSQSVDSSSCRYRSSSEGYISARVTPAPSIKKFTYDEFNEWDSLAGSLSADSALLKPKTFISNAFHENLPQQSTDQSGYLNTDDVNVDELIPDMDKETKDSACELF